MCYGMTQQEWEEYVAYMDKREQQARAGDKQAEPEQGDVETPNTVPQAFRDVEIDSEVEVGEELPTHR